MTDKAEVIKVSRRMEEIFSSRDALLTIPWTGDTNYRIHILDFAQRYVSRWFMRSFWSARSWERGLECCAILEKREVYIVTYFVSVYLDDDAASRVVTSSSSARGTNTAEEESRRRSHDKLHQRSWTLTLIIRWCDLAKLNYHPKEEPDINQS